MTNSESPLLKQSIEKSVRKKTLLGYTGIFAVLAALIFGLFFGLNGRSLIMATDGLSQHAPILAYFGEYLRTILKNIFVEHTFVIPMFDFSIGLGTDIVSTLHYYCIGDPLNLLSVFVPAAYTEYLYDFLVVLRMYLTGLTFSCYMLHRNSHASAIVTGAVSYAFSGFVLLAAVRHPFFLSGMIYCPLIFLGIDRILEKRSPILYIVSLSLIVLTNFYFAYMTCIIMLFYAALRYFTVYKKAGFKTFAQTVGKFAVYTVNAFLIPMVIFLPQIANVLSTDRLNADNEVNVLYPLSHYAGLLDSLTNPGNNKNWTMIGGITGIAVLCVILCFVRIRKHKNIAVSFSLAIVGVLFPIFGHIFNGFAYVTNRWSWIFAFIAALAVTIGYDELFELTAKEKKILWGIALVYLLVVCCIVKARTEITLLMLVVMFAVLGLACVCESMSVSTVTAKRVVSVLMAVSVFMQAAYLYDYREGNGTANCLLSGEVYDTMYTNTTAALIRELGDDSEFYRYDDYNSAVTENAAILGNVNSASYYYSIANSYVSQFIQEIGLNFSIEQRWLNFDNRYILQSLSGCKYSSSGGGLAKMMLFKTVDAEKRYQNQLTVNDGEPAYYKSYASHKSSEESSIQLKQLRYYMPMGYTYDSVMSRESYEQLSPAEKQNVLLQTAVTDDVDALPKASVRTEDVKAYDIFPLIQQAAKESDGFIVEGNSITVKDTSAYLEIEVPSAVYSECYMMVDDLRYTDISTYQVLREELTEELEKQREAAEDPEADPSLDPLAERQLKRSEAYYEGPESVQILISSDSFSDSGRLSYFTPKHPYYSGADTFMVYLGCTMFDDPEDTAEKEETKNNTFYIKFSHTGTYTMDDWSMCYQSLENVSDDYEKRTEDVLENVEITDCENTVTGTISLDETKILVMQIPYSDGWTATVDGEEAEILNVNTMFCGLLLSPGEHTVTFRYVTPHAKLAVAASAVGLIQLAATAIIQTRKKKKNQ